MALGIFLFLKQIVDMLYQFKILDYGMFIFALILLVWKIIENKITKSDILLPDILISLLMIIYGITFLKDTGGFASFAKIESAFVVYFLGRVYSDEISEKGLVLSAAGYIVIYLNLIVRFYHWNFSLVKGSLNDGGMYYYKNDLAAGVIIAVIFIYTYSKNNILKYTTIVIVASYLVFYSGARMQWPVLIIIDLFIIFKSITKKEIPKCIYRLSVTIFVTFCVSMLLAIQIFPYEKYREAFWTTANADSVIEKIMHSRHLYWFEILNFFSEQTFTRRILGFDLNSIATHNTYIDRAHSQYVESLYVTGYLGVAIMVIWIVLILLECKYKQNKEKEVTFMLMIFFLFSGLTIECLELTQMSWFAFLFAGIVITKNKRIKDEANC